MYKKISLIMLIAVLTAGLANAQLFVGGGVGVDFTGGKISGGSTTIKVPSALSLEIMPKVGYFLSDDLAIGAQFGFGISSTTITKDHPLYDNKEELKITETSWLVGAFARYRLAGTGDLSLFAEAGLDYAGLGGKAKSGSVTVEDDPTNIFRIGVLPVLSYNLSEKLSIEVSSDFLRFGFVSVTDYKNKGKESEVKATLTNFGLGLNSGSDMFTIGIVFKF